jgi:hypothetical protein
VVRESGANASPKVGPLGIRLDILGQRRALAPPVPRDELLCNEVKRVAVC